ncbi:hypothetical protein [Actinoplanes flavus]|uniref:Uncharacterized protein n=1 Tax=Actinoplanes flavus TaxID=2820290 RepID=A0ABS3UD40_9ACTN|nr:hypothetical protein [Actinoplanes flavus]MBO3736695.1 hypothetical protein [Actinoplanes flavus]
MIHGGVSVVIVIPDKETLTILILAVAPPIDPHAPHERFGSPAKAGA